MFTNGLAYEGVNYQREGELLNGENVLVIYMDVYLDDNGSKHCITC